MFNPLAMSTSNDEYCDLLINMKMIETEGKVAEAFRHIDKGDFVLESDRLKAYGTSSMRIGELHLSSPSIYAKVLEALELKEGMSVLNVGSGTGYFSCVMSQIIGPTGLCHGIEVNPNLVSHARMCTEKWINKTIENHKANGEESGSEPSPSMRLESITYTEGNCFHLDVTKACRYDRIYVGGGCLETHRDFFYNLLQIGGILVLPVEDEVDEGTQLVKVTRFSEHVFKYEAIIMSVHFSSLQYPSERMGSGSYHPLSAAEREIAALKASDRMVNFSHHLDQTESCSSNLEKIKSFVPRGTMCASGRPDPIIKYLSDDSEGESEGESDEGSCSGGGDVEDDSDDGAGHSVNRGSSDSNRSRSSEDGESSADDSSNGIQDSHEEMNGTDDSDSGGDAGGEQVLVNSDEEEKEEVLTDSLIVDEVVHVAVETNTVNVVSAVPSNTDDGSSISGSSSSFSTGACLATNEAVSSSKGALSQSSNATGVIGNSPAAACALHATGVIGSSHAVHTYATAAICALNDIHDGVEDEDDVVGAEGMTEEHQQQDSAAREGSNNDDDNNNDDNEDNDGEAEGGQTGEGDGVVADPEWDDGVDDDDDVPVPVVTLPEPVWFPNKYRHRQFPPSFRHAVMTILLCAGSSGGSDDSGGSARRWSREMGAQQSSARGIGGGHSTGRVAATRCFQAGIESVQVHLWHVILSYCNREWFTVPPTAAELLLQELMVERKRSREAERKLAHYKKYGNACTVLGGKPRF